MSDLFIKTESVAVYHELGSQASYDAANAVVQSIALSNSVTAFFISSVALTFVLLFIFVIYKAKKVKSLSVFEDEDDDSSTSMSTYNQYHMGNTDGMYISDQTLHG